MSNETGDDELPFDGDAFVHDCADLLGIDRVTAYDVKEGIKALRVRAETAGRELDGTRRELSIRIQQVEALRDELTKPIVERLQQMAPPPMHLMLDESGKVLAVMLKSTEEARDASLQREDALRGLLSVARALLKEESDSCLCILTPIKGKDGAVLIQTEKCPPGDDACWWCRVRRFLADPRITAALDTKRASDL